MTSVKRPWHSQPGIPSRGIPTRNSHSTTCISQADIYSFAVMLCEMLSVQTPFRDTPFNDPVALRIQVCQLWMLLCKSITGCSQCVVSLAAPNVFWNTKGTSVPDTRADGCLTGGWVSQLYRGLHVDVLRRSKQLRKAPWPAPPPHACHHVYTGMWLQSRALVSPCTPVIASAIPLCASIICASMLRWLYMNAPRTPATGPALAPHICARTHRWHTTACGQRCLNAAPRILRNW
jgi:hypothetical protein